MNFRLLFAVFIVLSIFNSNASAFFVLEPGENIGVGTVIDDDLYFAGSNVVIRGTVLGDVVAAGGLIEISGNVTGDVIAGAGNVIINGVVGDDVRVGTGTLIVNGRVGDDLVAGAGSIVVSDGADIGGDVVFGSGEVELRGDVGGNVTGGAGGVTLAGAVGGDADLDVESLNVLSTARIKGSLKYKSPLESSIPPGAVGKDVDFIEKEPPEEYPGSSLIWWVIQYLFLLVIGLVALGLIPNWTAAIARVVPENPLRNMGMGFLLVIAGFAGSILLFITVIGIPLGILLLIVTFIALYTAQLFFSLWLGGVIFARLGKASRPWMNLVLGLFILLIFTSLPWLGGVIYLLVTFLAIGVLYSEQKRFYRELRDKSML